MNRLIRSIVVPALAVVGVLAAVPSVAHADERDHQRSEARGDHERGDRERTERERSDRERSDRERGERERIERERAERERFAHAERERQQQLACGRASASGASARRLREMGCYVR